VVVASIGRLVASSDDQTARALLDLCPADDRSPRAGVVAYLRCVLREEPDLSGAREYRTLTAEDVFLGACYYKGEAADTLRQQSQWEYPSLERALREATKDGERYLNLFKVRGLQPRIAELAFRDVVRRLRGANAAERLRDRNAEFVASIPRPWRLPALPHPPPPADWADGDGRCYDVKCNPCYRSKQAKVGLRGFLIELNRSSDWDCSYPAFVFTHTDDQSCQWVYVGEYRPGTAANGHTGDRVLPFSCQLPDELRFDLRSAKPDLEPGLRLLPEGSLRPGWQLAVGRRAAHRQGARTTTDSFLDDVVARCVQRDAGTGLEHAIWEELTKATFDACSRCHRAAVDDSLKRAKDFIASREFPVRLPRIEGKPILSRWIEDVLKPLVDHWSQIRCPACGGSATRPGAIRLRDTRMTSEGSICGRLTCGQCGHEADGVTLLTHCHKCKYYPLIIGKNRVCTDCQGLTCEWRPQDRGTACGCCKMGCRRWQTRAEEEIASDLR
jgi:hypothetical protein